MQRIRERGDEPNKFEVLSSLERARAIFHQIDRPYKIGLNGEDLVDMIGSSIMYAFQRAAAEKIAKYDLSPSGADRMRQLFGGTPILASIPLEVCPLTNLAPLTSALLPSVLCPVLFVRYLIVAKSLQMLMTSGRHSTSVRELLQSENCTHSDFVGFWNYFACKRGTC